MSRIVVATSFPVSPARGGGQMRVLGLYGALARLGVEVDVVALVDRHEPRRTRELAPGLRETRVPKTAAHNAAEARLVERAGLPMTDIGLALHHELTPGYGDAVAALADGAAAVVACHPFAGPVLAARADAPLVYEAQDVELDLKTTMLAGAGDSADLLATVEEAERRCCRAAAQVLVCAPEDAARLGELYGLPEERAVVVPNGVDPDEMPFVGLEARRSRQRRLGLAGRPHVAFVGSWHEPNLVAVRDVIDAAGALPDARFVVLGSAGLAFRGRDVPANVDLCGIVAPGFVAEVLGIVDAAANPMRWGSGTNLKMLDYALAGAPIVSTEFGARGLGLVARRDFAPAGPDDLAAALERLFAEDDDAVAARVDAARERTVTDFSWAAIAARWHADERFAALLDGAVAVR